MFRDGHSRELHRTGAAVLQDPALRKVRLHHDRQALKGEELIPLAGPEKQPVVRFGPGGRLEQDPGPVRMEAVLEKPVRVEEATQEKAQAFLGVILKKSAWPFSRPRRRQRPAPWRECLGAGTTGNDAVPLQPPPKKTGVGGNTGYIISVFHNVNCVYCHWNQ